MAKPFYVVCKEFRGYRSKNDFFVASFTPVFGSSDLVDISNRVKDLNLELDNYLNSELSLFPVSLYYYKFFEVTNLD